MNNEDRRKDTEPSEEAIERSGQQQQRQDRGFEQPGGHQGLPQIGEGERQQGGGGQIHTGDKPGQHAGRQRNGGQDSH